jgi:hypothetical protein
MKPEIRIYEIHAKTRTGIELDLTKRFMLPNLINLFRMGVVLPLLHSVLISFNDLL